VTPTPAPPTSKAGLALLLLAVPCGLGAWYLLKQGNAHAHRIAWECYGGECSTNDPRILLFIAGIAANIAFFVFAMSTLRLIAFGAALALGPLAAIQGWREAVAGGLPAAEVSTETWIWGTVAGIGVALALLGLVLELRMTAAFATLLGLERVPAVVEDYQDPKVGSGFGTGTLVFRDRSGHPHRVRIRALESWTRIPLAAVYRAREPARARVALPWLRKPVGPAPAPAEPETPASLVDELERLAALRSEGHLTDEEFQSVKRRLLGS
jgi:hypothetical protein